MALGRLPGLQIDRTGIALIGVALLLAAGAIDLPFLLQAIDWPTIVLLFALMILSAQFQHAGFYEFCAARVTYAAGTPKRLLGLIVAVGGILSAILSNDVVVFAFTPLLCAGLTRRGLDPRPYLLGLAGGANAGSAATLIGNPQNILIGQLGKLNFWEFAAVCLPPAFVAMLIVYGLILWIWRRQLQADVVPAAATQSIQLDRLAVIKGLVAIVFLVGLFATPIPREISALIVAAMLLLNRRVTSRDMLSAVDWQLLLLFACLFAVTAAFADTGIAADALRTLEVRGLWPDRLLLQLPLTLMASNSIGNVPAVILFMTIWPMLPAGALYSLALLSTLAGNFLLVGSLANIIVAERAYASGVKLGFVDFARAGIPITVITMTMAAIWLQSGGWLRW